MGSQWKERPVAGSTSWSSTNLGDLEHGPMAREMTLEAAAACRGALAAGATEIYIKDAHESGRNMDIMFDTITNGSYGLKSIPGFPNIFAVFGLAALCIALMVLLINSSYGRAFKSIREDEVAAQSMGINLFHYKELSFVISSFFTGVGGGMLAMFMRSIDSKTFQVALTYDILLIVVLGGIGSVTGSVAGAFLVTAGRELLRFFDDPLTIAGVSVPLFRSGFRMVIFSILLMAVVLFYSRGIMGNHEFSWDGLFRLIRGIPGKFKRGRKKGIVWG